MKKQIREEFRIAPLVTPEMREAEDLWMQIWIPLELSEIKKAAVFIDRGLFVPF